MNTELWQSVDSYIRSGNLDDGINLLETGLQNCVSSRFKTLIGSKFSNNPDEVANELSNFINSCQKKFDVKAIYLEMNGFDINPDKWYFDYFGYKEYNEDPDDLDWLTDWDSDDWPEMTLSGLEKAQEDFGWYSGHLTQGYKDKDAKVAAEYATLLVMCKFAELIRNARSTGLITKKIPILATAHDFDIIPRFTA